MTEEEANIITALIRTLHTVYNSECFLIGKIFVGGQMVQLIGSNCDSVNVEILIPLRSANLTVLGIAD